MITFRARWSFGKVNICFLGEGCNNVLGDWADSCDSNKIIVLKIRCWWIKGKSYLLVWIHPTADPGTRIWMLGVYLADSSRSMVREWGRETWKKTASKGLIDELVTLVSIWGPSLLGTL